ncbi:unnamed protein product [Brachionus calyciflorus]|uniref:Acetyl-coenzyme A transporter 1 n=1 Tax=Brachionus calyciflorus TaxID=104777 RepID=A0A813YZG2_9BILA|nr:unnamed protein product [Brachionus calyciflorus]
MNSLNKEQTSTDVELNELHSIELDIQDDVFLMSSGPHNDDTKSIHLKPNIKKDLHNIIFLIFLYFLQGIPLGLTGSLPFIFGSRNVSYADQGTFSLAFWPFGLKLLWAPLVDSLFIKKIGRRKSWLVPMQYTIGILMFLFSNYAHQLLEVNETTSGSDIYVLTILFFILTFFAATQDIAVDGWGLTILAKENVSWASTCNSVGQTAGWFVGNVVFLVLQSANFSNNYIRPFFGIEAQQFGIVTIEGFMKFFGLVFLITTTLVLFFKKEKDCDSTDSLEDTLTLTQTYQLVLQIINLSCVKKLSFLLLTSKIAFGLQSMIYLKLIEKGVARESLGILAIPLTPFEIVLPLLISRFSNGPKPLSIFINTYPFRILSSSIMVFWVFLTPGFKNSDGQYGMLFFICCILINAFNSIWNTTQSVTLMSFFTRVSDKTVGGTYMTLLNTISNIGTSWPSTVSLYIVDWLSVKVCTYDEISYGAYLNKTKNSTLEFKKILSLIDMNTCSNDVQKLECSNYNGRCEYKIDAFYILGIFFIIVGLVWTVYFRKVINKLQSYPKTSWKLKYNF